MSEWISVKDKLPGKGKLVHVYCDGFETAMITSGEDVFGSNFDYWTDDGTDMVFGVTHWMPLPEPPKI